MLLFFHFLIFILGWSNVSNVLKVYLQSCSPRLEGDEITICEERSAPSAEELKKSMAAKKEEEAVVCIE